MERNTQMIRVRKEDYEYLKSLHLKDNTSTSVVETLHKILKAHEESPIKHKTSGGFVTFYN